MANTFLKGYEKEIMELALKQEDKVFYNSSSDHAAIVHKAIVKTASNCIRIFSSSMCSEISNNEDYLAAIKEYLTSSQDHLLNIVLTNYSEKFLNMPIAGILRQFPSQVEVKRYEGNLLYGGKPCHFTVADGRMFRFETDIDQHMAFGNFNNPEQAKKLTDIFDKIMSSEFSKTCSLAA